MNKLLRYFKCLPILFSGIVKAILKLNAPEKVENNEFNQNDLHKKSDQIMTDFYRNENIAGRIDYFYK